MFTSIFAGVLTLASHSLVTPASLEVEPGSYERSTFEVMPPLPYEAYARFLAREVVGVQCANPDSVEQLIGVRTGNPDTDLYTVAQKAAKEGVDCGSWTIVLPEGQNMPDTEQKATYRGHTYRVWLLRDQATDRLYYFLTEDGP